MDHSQLDAILMYRNENVISRFTDMFSVTATEAEEIFKETLKFLYICPLPGTFIPDELLIIDEMWHNFILFTKDYQAFCNTHFGQYLHHLPASKQEKEQQQRINNEDPEKAAADFNNRLKIFMESVFDHLGKETLLRWFTMYPSVYSKEIIKALRKC